jgi:hypothetical protein
LCALNATEEIAAVREMFRRMSDFSQKSAIQHMRDEVQRVTSQLGRNIALHCFAAQSSAEAGRDPTPQGAVNGVKTGRYGFHTRAEKNPWWMLDLGEEKLFNHILVYNRLDGPCRRRSRTLSVLISADATSWTELYTHDGTPFGGFDGFPLHIKCPASKARFVRLQLNEYNYLHLDQVEIYGSKDT